MAVERVSLRSFRSYERAELHLDPAVTVVTGENGAGKTNLLEALYFGCTGRSPRTTNEREVVAFGAPAARVTVSVVGPTGAHEFAAGFVPGEPKRLSVDGKPEASLIEHPERPLFGVFLPDRLDLVKGVPALRRAHLDRLVAGLWPARAQTRRMFGQALAQRNALLARIRANRSGSDALDAWDRELAELAVPLIADRMAAVALVAAPMAQIASELGISGTVDARYRSELAELGDPDAVAGWWRSRREGDVERGFTRSGPHRDELSIRLDGRELRRYGSQGQQRLGLLALLLAEREVLAAERGRPPVMLLDDVLSELDAERRERLIERVSAGGQALVTATELDHLPPSARSSCAHVEVAGGEVIHHAPAVAA